MSSSCSTPARLKDRRILITGAASGIGRATAELFAQHGAALVLVDRDKVALESCAVGGGVSRQVADLAQPTEITSAIAAGAQHIGGLDGVVNCAGITAVSSIGSMKLELWERVLRINLTAPYLVCQAALPWLCMHPSATIVNIASGQALLPDVPGASAYCASKGGLVAFSKALAAELAPRIRVNVVCPGLVETAMTTSLLADRKSEEIVSRYALRRAARARELAEAILFLSCAESSFVTGAALAVDGGRTFH